MLNRTHQTSSLLVAAALLLSVAACLPAYDPDEVTVGPGNNADDNNAANNNTTCAERSAEVCDGADNDCDGNTDEDFPRRGIPCGNNIGVCAAVTICEAGAELCYEITSPSDEICDGLDNDCDGVEDEITLTDPQNCGGCNQACTFDNGVAGCIGGECQLMGCSPGFEDCDQDPRTGCETDITSDPVNCGGCGSICGDDSAVTVCRSGDCSIESCAGGREDCNGFALDGCEADPTADVFNCGTCNNRCEIANAIAQCIDQSCGFSTCQDGFVDNDTNPANGCEVGLRVVGSPPDAGLGNLTVSGGLLFGASGSTLFGYELLADGSIGALRFTWTATSSIRQLDATGNNLYMALDAGDVLILNTLNVNDIQTEGVVVTSGPAPGFARNESTLYIADGRDGLRVVDATNPAQPRLVGRAASPGAVNSAFASGTRVILSSPTRADLDVYDVSNPLRPVRTGTFETTAPFDQAVIQGDLIITGRNGDTRLQIYRLSDDNQLTFLGSAELGGQLAALSPRYPFLIAVVGNRGEPLRVLTIDIRRPQRPTITNTYASTVPNLPASAAFTEAQIYVAGDGGLQRVNITDLRRPIGAQDLVRPQVFNDLIVRGNRMYVAADGAVEVLDITNPQSPTRVARLGTTVGRIALSDTALYVTGEGGFVVSVYTLAGLNDGSVPFATYSADTGLPLDIEPRSDNTQVYALFANRLDVIQINPTPLLLNSISFEASCRNMIRHDAFLYAACSAGIVVFNTNDINSPPQIIVQSGEVFDVELIGTTTVYGLLNNGIDVFTVNVPGNFTARNSVLYENVGPLRRLTSVNSRGVWSILSTGSQALLIDAANVTSPRLVTTRNLNYNVVELVSTGESVYAGTAGGVFRLAVEAP